MRYQIHWSGDMLCNKMHLVHHEREFVSQGLNHTSWDLQPRSWTNKWRITSINWRANNKINVDLKWQPWKINLNNLRFFLLPQRRNYQKDQRARENSNRSSPRPNRGVKETHCEIRLIHFPKGSKWSNNHQSKQPRCSQRKTEKILQRIKLNP